MDLTHLHTDRNRSRYTTGKAPHKPILVLTFIKLMEKGLLDGKHIRFDDIGVLETFRNLYACLNYDKPAKINYPLFHLESDGFYSFAGGSPTNRGYTPSLKQLREQFVEACLSDEFVDMVSDQNGREEAYHDLLVGGNYFGADEISRLNAQLGVLDTSFEYEKVLESKTAEAFQEQPVEYKPERDRQDRDPEFRRVVIRAYNNRCAVCGLSILSDIAGSPIQAAHILPFAEFQNDDPRNGIALCSLHHWAFDNMLLGVSTNYKVKISNTIDTEEPERVLSQYMQKKLLLPEEERFWPAVAALRWRVRERFVG